MTMEVVLGIYVFILAIFVGFEVIARVPSVLHTPLMSATNAIHGIVVLGAMLVAGAADTTLLRILGFIAVAYIVSAVFFIFGLKRLSSPATARSGNQLAAFGMMLALAATLLDRQILSFGMIAIGMLVGALVGTYFARTVQMTAMPQMVALFNGMGGATAALVSVAEYIRLASTGATIGAGETTSIVLGTIIGAVSFTGSIIAFGKLQEILPGRPIQFPLQRLVNGLILLSIVALAVAIVLGSTGTNGLWG